MMKKCSHVLSARWIVPVISEPIHGGWVQIEAGRVVVFTAGPGTCFQSRSWRCGDSALLGEYQQLS